MLPTDRPLRLLHLITRLIIGGAQETAMLLCEALARDPDRYEVAMVSGPQTGAEGSLIEEVRARGVSLTILPSLVREVSPANDLRALLALRAMMRGPDSRPRYDIVHTHSSKAGLLGRLAARAAGVPLIVHTVHGWSFHDRMTPRRRALFVAMERLGARAAHGMAVVSPLDIEKGLAHGIGRREAYTLIRSGIELERFGQVSASRAATRAAWGIPATATVIGSVTRLSPQKAPLDLVAALAHVHAARPEAWFVIVGDGPLRGEVEAALAAAGIAGRTVLTGLRRDIPEQMAGMDMVALTSLWEGLPRVIPQAMATGLPVVCTRADGSAEAVADGVSGFLVERGDIEALAARLITLVDDPALRARMGTAGRAAAPPFGAAAMVEQTDAWYRRLGGIG